MDVIIMIEYHGELISSPIGPRRNIKELPGVLMLLLILGPELGRERAILMVTGIKT